MSPTPDPTADRLLSDAWRSMRSVLDSAPQGRTLLQVSMVQVEFWADTVAGIQLLLQHPPASRVELVAGVGVLAFLAGLAVGLFSR